MAVVWTDLRDLVGGQFLSITELDANFVLETVGYLIDSTYFGSSYDRAYLLCAAHLLAQLQQGAFGAPSGPLISRSAGPFAESYGSPLLSIYSSRYDSTVYGQQLMLLIRAKRGKGRLIF